MHTTSTISTISTISARDWQPQLNGDAIVTGLDDIEQCIHIILTTPQGSDAHRPDFGCELWRYLDWPQNRLTPYVIRATITALRRWEKRIAIVKVSLEQRSAAVQLNIEWRVLNTSTVQTTRLELRR